MHPVLYLGLATACLHFVAVIAIDKFQRWRELRAFARKHQCQPARYENVWDLLGLYKVISAARHVIQGTALLDATRSFETLGDTYTSKLLNTRVFFTCHPRNMRQVLVTNFADFDSSRGIRDHLFRPITAHGIFALDGPGWKAARGLYRDLFSHTRNIFNTELQEECFQNLLARIPVGKPFDIQPLFLCLMLDLTTAFAMGESVDSLRLDQAPHKKEFVKSLMHVKEIIARDGFLGPVHVFLSKKKFHASCASVHAYVERVVRTRLEARRNLLQPDKAGKLRLPAASGRVVADVPPRECLLDGLLESSEDIEKLRDGVITILIAGIDSVASLLSTTFFLLARHERVMDKLRDDILEKIGQDPPNYDTLRSLTYLRQTFNESKSPNVPLNSFFFPAT